MEDCEVVLFGQVSKVFCDLEDYFWELGSWWLFFLYLGLQNTNKSKINIFLILRDKILFLQLFPFLLGVNKRSQKLYCKSFKFPKLFKSPRKIDQGKKIILDKQPHSFIESNFINDSRVLAQFS